MTLIVREPENDEDNRLQQEFFSKYPNAGKYNDMSDFYSRGVSSFTKEKLKDYKESGMLALYKNYKTRKQSNSKEGEYKITNAEKGELPDYEPKWDGIRQQYKSVPVSKTDDREVFVNVKKELPMTLEDYQSIDGQFFELPSELKLSRGRFENKFYCDVHDDWFCKHRPLDKNNLCHVCASIENKNVWETHGCNPSKHLNKELERGRELTQAEVDLDNVSIFDSVINDGVVTQVVRETNRKMPPLPPKFTKVLQHKIKLDDNIQITINPMSVEAGDDRFVFEGMSEPNPNMIKETKRNRIHKRARSLIEQLHDEERIESLAQLDKQFVNNKQFADEYFEETQRTPSIEIKTELSNRLAEIRKRRTSEILSYRPKTKAERSERPYQDVANFKIKTFDQPFVIKNLSQF